jgi:aspartyl aminopeptidase
MTHAIFGGFVASLEAGAPGVPLAEDTNLRIVASFDHEEVGSSSIPGAGSTLLEDTLARLFPSPGALAAAIRRSILVSADMAHACHPNYSGVHEENHRPALNGGLVIKNNANQR